MSDTHLSGMSPPAQSLIESPAAFLKDGLEDANSQHAALLGDQSKTNSQASSSDQVYNDDDRHSFHNRHTNKLLPRLHRPGQDKSVSNELQETVFDTGGTLTTQFGFTFAASKIHHALRKLKEGADLDHRDFVAILSTFMVTPQLDFARIADQGGFEDAASAEAAWMKLCKKKSKEGSSSSVEHLARGVNRNSLPVDDSARPPIPPRFGVFSATPSALASTSASVLATAVRPVPGPSPRFAEPAAFHSVPPVDTAYNHHLRTFPPTVPAVGGKHNLDFSAMGTASAPKPDLNRGKSSATPTVPVATANSAEPHAPPRSASCTKARRRPRAFWSLDELDRFYNICLERTDPAKNQVSWLGDNGAYKVYGDAYPHRTRTLKALQKKYGELYKARTGARKRPPHVLLGGAAQKAIRDGAKEKSTQTEKNAVTSATMDEENLRSLQTGIQTQDEIVDPSGNTEDDSEASDDVDAEIKSGDEDEDEVEDSDVEIGDAIEST